MPSFFPPHFVFLALAFVFLAASNAFSALSPVDLRCDYAVNPLGVDSPAPRLFWKLESGRENQKQSAYEIFVASSQENLDREKGDLWSSGKITSDETIHIPYAGRKLSSLQQVFWKVRVWDAGGKASGWSKPATWTMGILQDTDWHARWIGAADTNIPSLLLRHEFSVKPRLKRALASICGLGQYELSINGKPVGDDYLSPGWTKYDKTCLYDTRDITGALKPGKNAVGMELGNGMYQVLGGGRFTKFKGSFGLQKAIAQIRLEYADGSVDYTGTDENWRVAPGPITFSSIYGGEDCDARLLQPGWDNIGFSDSSWSPAIVVNGPGGQLRGLSCAAPPLKFFETHRAASSRTLTNGDTVYDLGQNAAHVPKISVDGLKGSRIRLAPSELTNADGSINQGSMGAGRRGNLWCEYIKGTDAPEVWSPKFFYVGCRYLQITCAAAQADVAPPNIRSVEGLVLQSDSEPVGEFECSNDLFNRTRKLVRWAQRSNMASVMTDCPHRERLGWLEQDHLNGPSIRYEFDMARLFAKTVNDIADSQLNNGLVPTTAPEYTIFRNAGDTNHLRSNFGDSLEWSSAFILVPWQQYEFNGDLNLFRQYYPAMQDYLNYVGARAPEGIADFGLGDWYDLGTNRPGLAQLTPVPLTATAFYFQDVKIMAQVARLLGKPDDEKRYVELAWKIWAAFNQKFYDPANHSYATGSQCANAIPLVMGLCERTNRPAVVEAIVRDVQARGNALTAGDVGYRYLLRALADGGRSDVIFDINNQTNKPGYGMQLAKGKTSLTEAWDGGSSQNHFMLGQIEEWFYHDLAGIQSATNGFKHIVIAPQPVGNVYWARAGYDSIRGKITSDWKRAAEKFTLKISVPANTTATIYVPSNAGTKVQVNSLSPRFLRDEGDRAIFEVGSGDYKFESVF